MLKLLTINELTYRAPKILTSFGGISLLFIALFNVQSIRNKCILDKSIKADVGIVFASQVLYSLSYIVK